MCSECKFEVVYPTTPFTFLADLPEVTEEAPALDDLEASPFNEDECDGFCVDDCDFCDADDEDDDWGDFCDCEICDPAPENYDDFTDEGELLPCPCDLCQPVNTRFTGVVEVDEPERRVVVTMLDGDLIPTVFEFDGPAIDETFRRLFENIVSASDFSVTALPFALQDFARKAFLGEMVDIENFVYAMAHKHPFYVVTVSK